MKRIILDSQARTPLTATVVGDAHPELTTVVVSKRAPVRRVEALRQRVRVVVAPLRNGKIDLRWLLWYFGRENVTSLLVEGGGEVSGSFIAQRLAHRVAFFYAPKILGGSLARKAVAGDGAKGLGDIVELREIEWRRLGDDWYLMARV